MVSIASRSTSDGLDRVQIDVSALQQCVPDALHVARADHGHDPIARSCANLLREVGVALVDERGLDGGHRLAELPHQLREHVAVADATQRLLVELGSFEDARGEGGEQHRLLPQGHRRPGAAQRHPHVPIAECYRDAVLLRHLRGFEQLRARHHAERAAELLLVGGQQQVRDQGSELLLADHLAEIEVLPALLLGQGLEALGVELDAHAVGPLLLDDLAHEIGGLSRHVRGADEHELASIGLDHVHVGRIVAPHHAGGGVQLLLAAATGFG
jgi:hypothetical protein